MKKTKKTISKKPKNKVTKKFIVARNTTILAAKQIEIKKAKRISALKTVTKVTSMDKVRIVPFVVKKLKAANSKNRMVSGPEIKNSIYKHQGIKINAGKLRVIIHYIRVNGLVKCLLATQQGYFITKDTLEMQVYLKSLNKRIRQIGHLRTSLDRQGHEILGQQFSTKRNSIN
jgi:hypothetical protein